MKSMYVVLAGALLLAFAGSYAASQPPSATARKEIFSHLKVGQAVEVTAYQATTIIRIHEDEDAKAMMKDKVKEIGKDYIVLILAPSPKDDLGVREMYLPLHSLHSILVFKKRADE